MNDLELDLLNFNKFGKQTRVEIVRHESRDIPVYTNEFWTAKQRAGCSLHEISYRACFKPQLPRFFIDRLTKSGDVVYDPFMGRGTTLLEAALKDRVSVGCDMNPLSRILLSPRLNPPTLKEVENRLSEIELSGSSVEGAEELLCFYHKDTLWELISLKTYLSEKEESEELDRIDSWIRMVATNRLTGHSSGFFSVYTMPPNQAVSIESQLKINERRNQTPPYRDVAKVILKKSKSLLNRVSQDELSQLQQSSERYLLLTGSADSTPQIRDESVSLVVTSPPFLDVVNYQQDNWLRCWFNGMDAAEIPIWQIRSAEDWIAKMTGVFRELKRVLKPGGHIAFEVGEIRKGKILMEHLVIPAAQDAGLSPKLILVNDQIFTKTANCWGITNQRKGTNTNRIILLRKEV